VSPLLSKFRSAGKKVQSANRIKSVVSGPPRTPALATAVASEDYNELFKRNEDFYRKLTSNRNESFQVLQDMVEQLGKKIQSTTQRSNDLVSSLQQLDEMIDEERRKWKQQNELEKNEATKGRSRLSQLNDDREVGEEKTF
jgi:exonuclease VII large subunit